MTHPGPRSPYPPPYPPPGPPAPPPPRRSSGRVALLVLATIGSIVVGIPVLLFVIAAISVAVRGGSDPAGPTPPAATAPAASTPAAPDPLDPIDLAEGDCYNAPPLPTDGEVRIASVEPVPCTQPHTAQVVARFAYPVVVWDDTVDATSTADCDGAFRARLAADVLEDEDYRLGRIHSDRAEPGTQGVIAVCLVATDARTSRSALAA